MTDNNHPISVPPELVKQMAAKNGTHYKDLAEHCQSIADQAARWGADQELKACLEEIRDGAGRVYIDESKLRVCLADGIWTARRPKPKSQAEEALASLEGVALPEDAWQAIQAALKRLRALEALDG